MNSMLETSFRKRSLGHLGTSFSGVLFKKKGNASLYKITSVLKEGKTPTVWREREFTITSDGTLSYTKPSTGSKGHSLELRDCFLRLGCPLQDKNGGYHVHVHTVDGAPTPFTFEIGLRFGLEASWSLCARTDKEMIEWIRCILSHMYPISMELLLGAPLSTASPVGETMSDPQLIGDNLSPIQEENMNSVQSTNRSRSPMIRRSERSIAMLHHQQNQPSSNLLSNPTVVGEHFSAAVTISFVRILEIGMGFLLFNLLILMIMFAVPGSPEAWLFAAAINLLVSFALLVRLEQIMVVNSGADESSNLSRLVSSTNVRTQSLPAGLFQHPNTLASNPSSGGNVRSTVLVSRGSGLTDGQGDSSGDEDNVDEVAVIDGDMVSISSNAGLSNTQISKRSLASSSLHVSQSSGESSAGSNETDSGFASKHSYGVVDAASLMVRVGPNYRRERRKAPSECALMTLVGCDLYYSKDKIDCIAEKLVFPEPSSFTVRASSPAEAPAAMSRPHPAGLPHFFVFNLQIQDQGPTLFGARNSSGYTLACYFEPSEEFVREVADMADGKPCSNAARLAHCWLTSFHKDQAMRERLKLKATIVNESAIDSLGWASKYNGKPAMITKSNTMTRLQARTQQGRICEVVEADVDLRMWNLLFRQGLSTVLPNVGKLSFNLALVIEGEADDELPERVLGAVQLNYLDLQAVSSWD